MKAAVTLLFSLLVTIAFAQSTNNLNFDPKGANYKQFLYIDTISNPNNIWQVGKPNKAMFDSAYSSPNALVTDTANTYPPGDTSVMMLRFLKTPKSTIPGYEMGFSFWYRMDVDSGSYGKIEVSGDNGAHWIDVFKESAAYDFWGPDPKTRLDTSNNEWQRFSVDMSKWGRELPSGNKYPSYTTADTFLIRFTFISDTDAATGDGWIIDNITYLDYYESISSIANDNLVSVYPNPASDYIYLKHNYSYDAQPEVTIYSITGMQVYQTKMADKNEYIYVNLPDGMYTLVYNIKSEHAVKQLVIQH